MKKKKEYFKNMYDNMFHPAILTNLIDMNPAVEGDKLKYT